MDKIAKLFDEIVVLIGRWTIRRFDLTGYAAVVDDEVSALGTAKGTLFDPLDHCRGHRTVRSFPNLRILAIGSRIGVLVVAMITGARRGLQKMASTAHLDQHLVADRSQGIEKIVRVDEWSRHVVDPMQDQGRQGKTRRNFSVEAVKGKGRRAQDAGAASGHVSSPRGPQGIDFQELLTEVLFQGRKVAAAELFTRRSYPKALRSRQGTQRKRERGGKFCLRQPRFVGRQNEVYPWQAIEERG